MKVWQVGTTDYDYDRYGKRVRKYVVTKLVKVHGKMQSVWEIDQDFKAGK